MIKIPNLQVYGCDVFLDTCSESTAEMVGKFIKEASGKFTEVKSPAYYEEKVKAFLGTQRRIG